ncbi:ABC transporter ATP-binding protein [Stratiformator vulcanicus]|uniref:Lipid A export ATP-binding/permease protein MsbA n=1 Tax=Stratiformator vulcanicus TaxID=2527980 RepID=A0A517R6U4_9PLAN|nr:ABC transporter ATP-binding protein [Stratiformator vulcanicus]QDT39608.1 Lipid A export ATP-binding/permease protein MsbA [Stratiformator vulcanicus]
MAKREVPIAGTFSRVWPYIWRYRKAAILSLFVAVLVSFFWGLNLSLTFPVVKVLLEGDSPDQYVHGKIERAELDRTQATARLTLIESQLSEFGTDLTAEQNDERVDLLLDQSKQQRRLSAAGQTLLIMNWVDAYVLPLLPADQFDLLAVIFLTLFITTVIKGICVFIQDVLVGTVIERTIMDLRKEMFRKTLALDYQTVAMRGTPELMSRFTNDMGQLSYGLQIIGGRVVREPLKAMACIVGAMCVSWRLTLLSMIVAPLAGFILYSIGKRLKKASHRVMESMSQIYKTLEETFDSMKVVIAFNGAPSHRRRFHHQNKSYYRKALKIVSIEAMTSPTTEALGFLAAFGALLPGAYLVLRGVDSIWGIKLASNRLDIAELSLLYGFLAGTLDPLRKLSSIYNKLKRSTAAADRIFGLMDSDSLLHEPTEPKRLPRLARQIEFKEVEFHYAVDSETVPPSHRRPVLDGIDLTVKAGEVVAVVGGNGSGKSTLLNLLPRFFDPTHGNVSIDGIDLRDVRLRELRDQIAMVTQETHLFDATIEENIRYGRPGATEAEVHEAARRAHVTDFLSNLAEGIKTPVGEKGRKLSGGQRQRIALARAILRDPAILILDEATSAVDANSEKLIQEAIGDFATGRTVFLITHSVSKTLLQFVTKVAVMQHGRLIGYGSHHQLLETCPAYRKSMKTQGEERAGNFEDAEATEAPHAEASAFDPEEIDSPIEETPVSSEPPHSPPMPKILSFDVARRVTGTDS